MSKKILIMMQVLLVASLNVRTSGSKLGSLNSSVMDFGLAPNSIHHNDALASPIGTPVSESSSISMDRDMFSIGIPKQRHNPAQNIVPLDNDIFGDPLPIDVKILQNNNDSWHFPNENGNVKFDPLVIGQALQHNRNDLSCMTPLAKVAAYDITGRVRQRKISEDINMKKSLSCSINSNIVKQVLYNQKSVVHQFNDLNQEVAKQKAIIEQIHTQFCSVNLDDQASVLEMYKVPEHVPSVTVKKYAGELRGFESRIQDAVRDRYIQSSEHATTDFKAVQHHAHTLIDNVQQQWEVQKPTKRGMFGWNGIPGLTGIVTLCIGAWNKHDNKKKNFWEHDVAMIGGGVFAGWNIFRMWQKYNNRQLCNDAIQYCEEQKQNITNDKLTLENFDTIVDQRIGTLNTQFAAKRNAMISGAVAREIQRQKEEKKESRPLVLSSSVVHQVEVQQDTTETSTTESYTSMFLRAIAGISHYDPTLHDSDDD